MRRGLTLSGVCGAFVIGVGLVIGARPLGDNSFLTHLATGHLILDTHRVPTHDVFTFTAAGHEWVVQSWLASLLYAIGDNAGGLRLLMVANGLLCAVLAGLVWLLTAPAHRLIPRLGIATTLLIVGSSFWVERPLLLGLIAMALALLAAEGKYDPRWLVLVMWLWVNVHGSFPLGFVALAALAIGRRLDGESPAVELAALRWAAIGTLLGALSPVGPKLLLFPITLLSRQDILRYISEWQAPGFTSFQERAFLLEVLVVVALAARRPSWRSTLPAGIFIGAALLGARNVGVASIVLVPGLARSLADVGSLEGSQRRPLFRFAAAIVLAGAAIVSSSSLSDPGKKIAAEYPVRAVDYATKAGILGTGRRVITQDFVGNYLEARLGTAAHTFVDDRYDMLPKPLVEDYKLLLGGGGDWSAALARYRPDAVLWQRDLPLSQLLQISPSWRIVYTDGDWIIAEPR